MTGTIKPIKLSVWETIDFFFGLLEVLYTVLKYSITGFFRGSWGADTYRHHITHSVIRKLVTRYSVRQLQWLTPSFGTVYIDWCKANHVQPEFVDLPSGCRGFWVGDKKAQYITVYYHGGGFSLPGGSGHLAYWSRIQASLSKTNPSNTPGQPTMATFYMEYTLTPHATYPTQLCQAASAILYVLTTCNKPLSSIILAGDSAGGNACLGMLSHLTHPSDQISPRLPGPEAGSFKALALTAPWVSFITDWPSTRNNKYKDIISDEAARLWSSTYFAGKPSDAYAEPFIAPDGWWKDARVENMVVVAGRDELFLDPISEWMKKYEKENPQHKPTFIIAPNECHIAAIKEPDLGDHRETLQERGLREFLAARL